MYFKNDFVLNDFVKKINTNDRTIIDRIIKKLQRKINVYVF